MTANFSERGTFYRKVREYIERSGLILQGDAVVVAVSGGVDSRVLLEILLELRDEYALRLILAHANHKLRAEESDRDEDFVRELARSLQLCVEVTDFDNLKAEVGHGDSLQVVARRKRYRFLESVRRKHGARVVALGHTQTDQAETVLLRLVRGSGLKGISGIPPFRAGGIIRPLLCVGRAEIVDYACHRGLQWVEDSSNASSVYLRNRLRMEVMPLLVGFNPRLEVALSQLAETARRDELFLEEATSRCLLSGWIEVGKDEVRIDRGAFLALHPALQYRLFRKVVDMARGDGSDSGLGFVHISTGITLAREAAGTRYSTLPGGLLMQVQPNLIVFYRPQAVIEPSLGEVVLNCPGQTVLPTGERILAAVLVDPLTTFKDESRFCWLDVGELCLPLTVRYCQEGDRFFPLGAPRPTRLSEFFIRQKIPRPRRGRLPLVVSGDNIVWIAGIRSSEFGKISASTRRILRLELLEQEGRGEKNLEEAEDSLSDTES